MFLKNALYVAAWDHEITHDLQQIMVLGEKICMSVARLESWSDWRMPAHTGSCRCRRGASRATRLNAATMA